ncbi:MAG: L-rhamnose mutarotase [Bacteroidetes bacterium]|nr:L-rhamnose mutarotase [Bacteroidota bacterium]
MDKIAFKMKLKPGFKKEYKHRHDAIWPELKELLSKSGVRDYTIFLDEETNTLFAIQYQAGDNSSQDLGSNPIVQKWWKYMEDIMETNPDSSPVSIPLEKVFHMD